MKAIVKSAAGVRLAEVPTPAATGPNDVRVRLLAAGVCRTDLLAARGKIPVPTGTTLGHELCGDVDQVGRAVERVRLGDRVAVDPFFPCGDCPTCRGGDGRICPHARFLGVDSPGAFAEWIMLPERAVHPLPAALDPRVGAYAEPVAAALSLAQLDGPPAARGALVGKNRFSQLAYRVLTAIGRPAPLVFDEAAAFDHRPHAFDYVVECRPDAAVLAACIRLLRPGGTLVLKSRSVHPTAVVLGDLVRKGLRLQGLHYGDFTTAVRMLADSAVDVSDLLGRSLPLAAGVDLLTRDEVETDKTFLIP